MSRVHETLRRRSRAREAEPPAIPSERLAAAARSRQDLPGVLISDAGAPSRPPPTPGPAAASAGVREKAQRLRQGVTRLIEENRRLTEALAAARSEVEALRQENAALAARLRNAPEAKGRP